MPHDSKKGYQIYYSLLGMMLTFALISWINDYFVLKVHAVVSIIYSIVPAVLLHIFDRNKKNTISYLILLGFLPIGGLIFFIKSTNPITWATNIIDWIIRYDSTDYLYEMAPAHTVLAAVALIGGIVFYLISKKSMARLLLGVFIIAFFMASSVIKIHVGKVVVGIGIFYILNILIELSGKLYSKKIGTKDKKESILYLLPVCFLLAVIAAGLPSKSEPIQWTGVKNIYYSMKDRIDKLVTTWEFFVGKGEGVFSISLSGFSEDASLDNDDLVSNQKIALIVDGQSGLAPIYLTGSVNDVYTGYSWEKSKEDSVKDEIEYQMDYGELIYGLSRLEPQIVEDFRFVETRSIDILYNNIKTKTLFYPSKSKWFQFNHANNSLDMEFAGITFLKARGNKTAYKLSYYEMNLQGLKFQEMLRMADGFSYDESRNIDYDRINWLEDELYVRDRENFVLNRQNFYELYKERADTIYHRYTQLPQGIPERVKDLAHELTRDEDTKYDKLKTLEEYLIGYEYSYTPGRVPEGADFVDYFLFDNKKGYCTSFATAMAVLGRCIGIPTRYVEGYVVNYRDRNDSGYLVRNSNAHAWMEAYFDGVGWIPFEATPSFNEMRYTPWAPKSKHEDIGTGLYNRKEVMPPMAQRIDDGYIAIGSRNNSSSIIIWVLVTLATVLILLAILTSYYLILQRRYRKEFDEFDNSEKMYHTFLRILRLLKYEGFSISTQDTLLMLSDRIKDRYQYNNVILRDIVEIFMAYRYGEVDVTDKGYDKVRIFYKGLMKHHENNTKALKLHMEEFLFLIKTNSSSTTYQD